MIGELPAAGLKVLKVIDGESCLAEINSPKQIVCIKGVQTAGSSGRVAKKFDGVFDIDSIQAHDTPDGATISRRRARTCRAAGTPKAQATPTRKKPAAQRRYSRQKNFGRMTTDPKTTSLIRLVDRAYDDALAPAAKRDFGQTLQTVGATVNAILHLFAGSYSVFRKSKIASGPRSARHSSQRRKMRPIPLQIAGPAVTAYAFAAEEPELQALFAELLAAAMDTRTADNVHPLFVFALQGITQWTTASRDLCAPRLALYSIENGVPRP